MPAQSHLTIALDPAVSTRLDQLAQREGKDAAELAAAAVADYVALDADHVAEIEAALREADAGDFATDAEVEAVFARWSADRPR
jgi:RHH-type transcriptional regulator, rel operon repressor / antitoxin RelB